ncbi:Uncharacterised protein [Serratia marcescens]|nr:Uncharacterised protein [Serratia marcescens]
MEWVGKGFHHFSIFSTYSAFSDVSLPSPFRKLIKRIYNCTFFGINRNTVTTFKIQPAEFFQSIRFLFIHTQKAPLLRRVTLHDTKELAFSILCFFGWNVFREIIRVLIISLINFFLFLVCHILCSLNYSNCQVQRELKLPSVGIATEYSRHLIVKTYCKLKQKTLKSYHSCLHNSM